MGLDGRDLNVPNNRWQHVRDHHLVHRSVWEANECGVLVCHFPSLLVLLRHGIGRVRVLFLRNVEVVVDKEGAEWDHLLVACAAEFVVDGATVLLVDGPLVVPGAEGQVVDIVGEVDLVALLNELDDDVGAVMRRQVEVARNFVHFNFTFDLASLLVFKLSLCRPKDHVSRPIR